MKLAILKQLSGTLYSAVIMELFERLAYYGMVLVLSIYMVQELGIRADLYGTVYGVFTGALYLLPLIAGALADRYGYKPALIVAFATLTAGYAMLGSVTEFPMLCVALGLIAIGGSIIKPTISGTVTRTTEEGSTRPVGFGLYYMMINAGGLIGPVLAAQVRNRSEFRYVFWVSAAACALMLLQALLAFREPVDKAEQTESAADKLRGVFEIAFCWVFLLVPRLRGDEDRQGENWARARFLLLLVIFSGFWGMMNILFGFMPLFLETFTDLRAAEAAIDQLLPLTSWFGQWLNPEVFVSLDALLIVLFQAAISYLTRRWPTLRAMLVGTLVASCGWILPGLSPVAWVVALGITVWSVGEMLCSARFFEYCGTVAPKEQVAVYLGYSFFSVFIGNLFSGPWAGWLYQRYVQGPLQAGLEPTPAVFFAGVIAMGAASAVGLALYGRFVAPAQSQSETA